MSLLMKAMAAPADANIIRAAASAAAQPPNLGPTIGPKFGTLSLATTRNISQGLGAPSAPTRQLHQTLLCQLLVTLQPQLCQLHELPNFQWLPGTRHHAAHEMTDPGSAAAASCVQWQ
jgi:hypothetical protein